MNCTINDLIGKEVTELFPDSWNDHSYLLKEFGSIVHIGFKYEIDEYSSYLGRWYKIKSFSSDLDVIVTISFGITDQKKELDYLSRLQNLWMVIQMGRTRITALTAGAIVGEREYGIHPGMDHYITKPIARKELVAKLMEHLQKLKNEN